MVPHHIMTTMTILISQKILFWFHLECSSLTLSTIMYVLHYSHDVKRDSTVLYNIDLKTTRQSTPQHEELDELSKRIETLLKQ